jgi:hypothetical protein
MSPDKGPVIVFVEELGEKWVKNSSNYSVILYICIYLTQWLSKFNSYNLCCL